MSADFVTLSRDENQALALGRFARDFMAGRWGELSPAVAHRTELFHLDSIACAVSAIAAGTNAPNVLRREALEYRRDVSSGVPLLASDCLVAPEKAVLANCAAAREWDANGTNFGYNPARGHVAGEFGHNDFYPVAVAAAQLAGLDGRGLLRAMVLLDEIRGRLAEVFSLKTHKIDHVVHGAIACAVVYGAVLGASPEQIESALGILLAHYIPFRAIRAGHQLSDSKGASAAISAEAAVLSVHRALRGFIGPGDVFRNRQAIFCLFEPPPHNQSPFDLVLATRGDDFAVMGMHFKLGLYEHQSAGAIAGLMELLARQPALADDPARLQAVRVLIYQPAFGIIADPHKRDPRTRQSADHSLVYIVATLLRKAIAWRAARPNATWRSPADAWRELMLLPDDYSQAALFDPLTRQVMERIEVHPGGPEYDALYPEAIPTSLQIDHAALGVQTSGLVMFPLGHARCLGHDFEVLLEHKFQHLAELGVEDTEALKKRFSDLGGKTAREVRALYDFELRRRVS
jgi:2-methylcitrate dehydratase